MKENEETKIPYQFTASPLNLMYILDSDCLKMLNLLIQEDSYWRSQGQLKDDYFFKSINDLKDDMFMANDQDVRLTIEALYANDLVDVINQGDKHKASKFKINQEKIKEIDSRTILDVKKFYPRICKFQRGHSCSYMKRKDCTNAQKSEVDDTIPDSAQVPGSATNCSTDCHTNCTTDCSTTCTPKLNKSYSINKIDDNIINNNIIDNEVIEEESFHSLNIEIGDKGKGSVDINDQEVINASVTSQTDAQHLEPTTLEDRLNDYLDNRPEKVALSMRVMSIKEHFHPDEYQAIDTIVRRKEYKHYNIRDYIMRYLTE